MARVFGRLILTGFILLSGCSVPPEVPKLEHPTQPNSDIILRDSLSYQDVRTLVKAVNQNGQFKHLSQLIENSSDNDLLTFGTALNLYLYQEALNNDGLPSLLDKRTFEKTFSRILLSFKQYCSSSPCQALSPLLKASLTHPNFPTLLQRNSYIFSSEWIETWDQLKIKSPNHALSKLLNNPKALKKISQTFQDITFQNSLKELVESFKKSELGKLFFLSLTELNEEKGSKVFFELSDSIKQAVAVTSSSPISLMSRLLTLTETLNQPSQSLFSKAQETLNTDEGQTIIRLLAERFEPLILKGAAGFIRETLIAPLDDQTLTAKFWLELPRNNTEDLPTENLSGLNQRIQYALDKMSGTSSMIKDPNITLNAFILALWFEQFALENKDLVTSLSQETFNEQLWEKPHRPFNFTLNLIEVDASGKPLRDSENRLVLSSKVFRDLKALGLEEFAQDLKYRIKQESFGPTITKISHDSSLKSLNHKLSGTITLLHRNHSFADPVPFLTSVFYGLTRSESGFPFFMKDFESKNMLFSLQNFLRGLSFSQVRKIVTFLFEDLQIGKLSVEDRERLKSLYPQNPECAQLLDSILQNLHVIYELDRHLPNQMSLLEVYHRIVSHSRPQDLKALSSLLSFFQKTKLFEITLEGESSPALSAVLSESETVGSVLTSLASLTNRQQTQLLQGLSSMIGSNQEELDELFQFLTGAISDNLTGISQLYDWVHSNPSLFLLRPEERTWLKRVTDSKLFLEAYPSTARLFNSSKLEDVLSEIETLQAQGELESAFKILGNFQSDRMQRLALALWNWEKSGELKAFISLIKTLTKS